MNERPVAGLAQEVDARIGNLGQLHIAPHRYAKTIATPHNGLAPVRLSQLTQRHARGIEQDVLQRGVLLVHGAFSLWPGSVGRPLPMVAAREHRGLTEA